MKNARQHPPCRCTCRHAGGRRSRASSRPARPSSVSALSSHARGQQPLRVHTVATHRRANAIVNAVGSYEYPYYRTPVRVYGTTTSDHFWSLARETCM